MGDGCPAPARPVSKDTSIVKKTTIENATVPSCTGGLARVNRSVKGHGCEGLDSFIKVVDVMRGQGFDNKEG